MLGISPSKLTLLTRDSDGNQVTFKNQTMKKCVDIFFLLLYTISPQKNALTKGNHVLGQLNLPALRDQD